MAASLIVASVAPACSMMPPNNQYGAHRIGKAGRMHARIQVGHTQRTKAADEDEHATGGEQ